MHRVLRAQLVVLLIAGVMGFVPSASAGDPLVFDLSTAPEHDADILWNVLTDNITSEARTRGVEEVWNSRYLTGEGVPGGFVSVDPTEGVVSGQISERWVCEEQCGRWAYWDAEISATITSAQVVETAISGTVAIEYRVRLGADEQASDCGGAPCYNCKDRFCETDTVIQATTRVKGSLVDRTLQLEFVDRLAEDATAMDLTDLRRVEFAMSRWFVAGVEAQSSALPTTGDVPAEADESAGLDASGDAAPPEDDGSPDIGESDDRGVLTAIGLAVAIALLIAAMYPRSRKWFTEVIQSSLEKMSRIWSRPAEPPPPAPGRATYVTGDTSQTFETTVEEAPPPPPPPPLFEIVGTKESGYAWVEARTDDGSHVYRFETGTTVEVVQRLEHLALVRPTSGGPPVWVDRHDLREHRES